MSKSVGDRIKELRTNAKLTLEEVGKKIGVSRATVQRYESGEISGIPYDKIEKIAELLKVSPSRLMGWEAKTLATSTINGVVDISDRPYLKAEEVALLSVFERLNKEGKDRLLDYGYDLVEVPKYTEKNVTSAS